MKLEKTPAWLVQLFDALLPEVGGDRKQMFGSVCAFEEGQMFAGLFKDSFFVRLGQAEREALLGQEGATQFDPMGGRPMKEYAVLPPALLEDEEAVKAWMAKARAYARTLPAKKVKLGKRAAKKAVPGKSAAKK